jgi:hypothetical protein
MEQKTSEKMEEFLDKVDKLCYEYGYQIYPTVEGWTGRHKLNDKGEQEYETIAVIGNGESVKLIYIDGDGRGK